MWSRDLWCSQPGERGEAHGDHHHPGAEVEVEAEVLHEAAQQLRDENDEDTAASVQCEGDGEEGDHSRGHHERCEMSTGASLTFPTCRWLSPRWRGRGP